MNFLLYEIQPEGNKRKFHISSVLESPEIIRTYFRNPYRVLIS